MKRDPDLVRKILILLDEKPDDRMIKKLELDGHSFTEIMYHFILMDQAGFIRCEREVSTTTPDRVIRVYPFSLTWQGHEFLEASRSESTWNNAKLLLKSKSGALSFEILKAVLVSMSRESVGV